MRDGRSSWRFVLVLICGLDAACVDFDSGASGQRGGAPTFEELRGATYHGIADIARPVSLDDGVWRGKPYAEGALSRPQVRLVEQVYLTADMNADGTDEALVMLSYSGGGSGEYLYLAVMARERTGIRNVATAMLGDRIQVVSAVVAAGHLELRALRAGPHDPACCPGEMVTQRWVLDGSGRLVAEEVAGSVQRFSLASLSAAEWVLRQWSHGEEVPTEGPPTLTLADGRFVGFSGCNRYFANVVAGTLPGQIEVGPAGGTRMACPDAAMVIEARFLRQLSATTNIGFVFGRLALTYAHDGQFAVMVFERLDPGP